MKYNFTLLISSAVLALLLTFFISVSEIAFSLKLGVFAVITISYVIVSSFIYKLRETKSVETHLTVQPEVQFQETAEPPENSFPIEIEEKLLALEEANAIFSSSLKPADMFRLISNRINEIIPFSLAALYLTSADKEKLKISYAFGNDATSLIGVETEAKNGLAGKVFNSGQIRIDADLAAEKANFPLEVLKDLKTGVACPLVYEDDSYGVLALYNSENKAYDDKTKKLLSAVTSRISPLFISSIAFENNLNSSLNDPLTELPNERALFMLLENQVAESQRFREQRPLTVLSFDIKKFAELNNTYGHATGDRILGFVAKNIKAQLRQMDFLTRVAGDEFIAVLPTSSERTTKMIVERIKNTFSVIPFSVTDDKDVFIELNFGQASFIKDGETAQDLMKIAAIKKREAKSAIKSTVLWFPKDYSN